MSESSWTLETLKEHLDGRIDAIDRYFRELRNTDQQAIKTAQIAFEKRMDTTNEWRGALDDQTKRLATIQQVDALKDQFDKLEGRVNLGANKAAGIMQMAAIIGGVITIAGVIIAIFAVFRGTAG